MCCGFDVGLRWVSGGSQMGLRLVYLSCKAGGNTVWDEVGRVGESSEEPGRDWEGHWAQRY